MDSQKIDDVKKYVGSHLRLKNISSNINDKDVVKKIIALDSIPLNKVANAHISIRKSDINRTT